MVDLKVVPRIESRHRITYALFLSAVLTSLSALLTAAWLPALPALLTSSSLATLTTTLLAAAWLPALPALVTSSSLATLTTTLLAAALLTIVFFIWHFVTPLVVSFQFSCVVFDKTHSRKFDHACDAVVEQPDGCPSHRAAFSKVSASEALQTTLALEETCQRD
jgi:hypothetical protein